MPSVALPPRQISAAPSTQVVRAQNDIYSASSVFKSAGEEVIKSQRTSETLKRIAQVDRYIQEARSLVGVPLTGNNIDSPPPNGDSIEGAIQILQQIKYTPFVPERLQPSAEGGIALTYVGAASNRALVEVTNEGERYAILYNMEGTTEILDWSLGDSSLVMKRLGTHLQGVPLAAHES